jgi:hypothetical protein
MVWCLGGWQSRAKLTTSRALTLYAETLFQAERRLGWWPSGRNVKISKYFIQKAFLSFETVILKMHHFLCCPIYSLAVWKPILAAK